MVELVRVPPLLRRDSEVVVRLPLSELLLPPASPREAAFVVEFPRVGLVPVEGVEPEEEELEVRLVPVDGALFRDVGEEVLLPVERVGLLEEEDRLAEGVELGEELLRVEGLDALGDPPPPPPPLGVLGILGPPPAPPIR